jgi:hypothetical protein
VTRTAFLLAIASIVLCRGSALATSETAAPLVALEGSSTIVFADHGGTRKAMAAVKPTTARPRPDEEPSVIEFSLGELRNPAPAEALKIKWRRAKDPANAPEAIELELDNTVRRPGLYTVQIAPLPLSNPAERLRIQIDIKPAKLVLPQKLVVARTINLPFQTSALQPKLEVGESDRTTRVSMLTVSRASAFAGTLPIAAGVTPDPKPVAIPGGQSAEVKYSVDEGVPLGTVTGTLRFSAAELVEPVVLDYEVRTKLTSWFIPVIIAFGFLLGWLVRKHLVDVAQLGEAREKAKTLLVKVNKSLAERPDADFHASVNSFRDALDNAQNGKKTAAIVDATKELDDKWRAALVEFDRRKIAATEKLAELKSLAGPPLPLPHPTDKRLDIARNAVTGVVDAVARNNVAKAELTLKNEESLAEDIWKIALAWQEQIVSIVRNLQTLQVGLPLSIQTQFAEQAKAVAFDRITVQYVIDKPELRRALLIEFHAEARDARVLLSELSTRLAFEWNLITKAVEPIRSKLQPEYDLLAEAILSFQRDLEHAADDPEPFKGTLQKRLEKLDTLWRATLISKAPPTTAADKLTALKALNDTRQYLQLARDLVSAFGGVLLSASAVARESGPVPWPTTSMEWLLPPAFDRPQTLRPESPDPVETLTPEKARFLQSAILAVIYIAVYWMLNADGFGSSMTDVAMLFITSFALDLSVEGILKLKK